AGRIRHDYARQFRGTHIQWVEELVPQAFDLPGGIGSFERRDQVGIALSKRRAGGQSRVSRGISAPELAVTIVLQCWRAAVWQVATLGGVFQPQRNERIATLTMIEADAPQLVEALLGHFPFVQSALLVHPQRVGE